MIKSLIGKINHSQSLAPFKHQEDVYLLSRDMKYYGLFWEMGTGKSKPIVDSAQHLFLIGEIDGLVIVSDKGCYLNWSREEIPIHWNNKIPHRISEWSSAMRAEDKLKSMAVLLAQDDVMDFVVMNVEAFSSDRACDYLYKFLASHYTMLVVDESTSIKNIRAERTKRLIRLGHFANYRRILTGTPIVQDPLDLYAQCEFLKPGVLGFKNFVPFRCHYAQMERQYLGPNRPSFDKIVGWKNLDQLTKSIEPFTSRILKSECLDLPEKLYEVRRVELSPEQREAYESLKRTAILQHESGLLTSTSALTTINKLQQICCGHVKLDDGRVVDLPSVRIPLLMELLSQINEKVIIWCAFQRDVELIVAALAGIKTEAQDYAVHYYGLTTADERANALHQFKNYRGCKWFVGTAATGGKGITLTEARYVVYYSNTYSLEDRLQSEDRAHRIGQDRAVTYIDIVAENTVDEKILPRLKEKRDVAATVLDDFRTLV